MRIPFLSTVVFLLVGLSPGGVSWSQNTQDTDTQPQVSFPVPENLVLDLRVFESRTGYPDYPTMQSLSFYIRTDGRGVTAEQWPSTLAKKVQESFVAALIYDTAPVEEGVTHFEWTKGSRSIKTEVRIEKYHPAGTFKAHLDSQFMRGSRLMRELSREVELMMGRTSVWSSGELEISASDYLSHFREYEDREARGLMYELLRPYTIFLVMAVTPRVLTEDETSLGPPESLSLPPDAELPELNNSSGVPLQGTIVLGFDLDANGAPVNPQVLRSTLPEANLRVVEEALNWRFLPSESGSEKRRGELEIKLDLP